ncbi:hypothetical protein M1563_04160 [Patescibacteria group bacterium]|nr:hypothetical protein [Patescibacteria group bacterium]
MEILIDQVILDKAHLPAASLKPLSPHIFKNTYKQAYSKHKAGLMLAISGPSGVGKDSVVSKLDPQLFEPTKNVTTRTRRVHESTEAYYWLSKAEFAQREQAGEFVETNSYDDNRYGTWRPAIEAILERHKVPVFRVDPQGVQNLSSAQAEGDELFKNYGFVYIYLLPPTLEELKERLHHRTLQEKDLSQQEVLQVVAKRLQLVDRDLSFLPQADYVAVNSTGQLNELAKEIEQLIISLTQ